MTDKIFTIQKAQDGIITKTGKLIFVRIDAANTINGLSYRKDTKKIMVLPVTAQDHKKAQYFKPYIISEMEELSDDINEELAFLIDEEWSIACFDELLGSGIKKICRILIWPEEFTMHHHVMIADKLIEENDLIAITYEK